MSSDASSGMFNKIITKLVQNFRSHASILQIPSQLFYESELIPKAPPSKTGKTLNFLSAY